MVHLWETASKQELYQIKTESPLKILGNILHHTVYQISQDWLTFLKSTPILLVYKRAFTYNSEIVCIPKICFKINFSMISHQINA